MENGSPSYWKEIVAAITAVIGTIVGWLGSQLTNKVSRNTFVEFDKRNQSEHRTINKQLDRIEKKIDASNK